MLRWTCFLMMPLLWHSLLMVDTRLSIVASSCGKWLLMALSLEDMLIKQVAHLSPCTGGQAG